MPVVWQGPGGVANLHVETAIDEASGKLTMLYQARPSGTACSIALNRKSFALMKRAGTDSHAVLTI